MGKAPQMPTTGLTKAQITTHLRACADNSRRHCPECPFQSVIKGRKTKRCIDQLMSAAADMLDGCSAREANHVQG